MFEIRPASGFSNEALRGAMLDAFSDYPIPIELSQDEFDTMMVQRGLDFENSRVAIIDGHLAGIWLAGIRGSKAYLISCGTRPAYRSLGIARAMATDCILHLRGSGVGSFQTEVLRNNELATRLYCSLGMTKKRVLDCYRIPRGNTNASDAINFVGAHWDEIAPHVVSLRDWEPSWQNNDQSLSAISEQLMCLALYDGSELMAYSAFEAGSGTVHQIAVRQDMRRAKIATSMLCTIQTQLEEMQVRLINVCRTDRGFRALMNHLDANETIGQYELVMPLH